MGTGRARCSIPFVGPGSMHRHRFHNLILLWLASLQLCMPSGVPQLHVCADSFFASIGHVTHDCCHSGHHSHLEQAGQRSTHPSSCPDDVPHTPHDCSDCPVCQAVCAPAVPIAVTAVAAVAPRHDAVVILPCRTVPRGSVHPIPCRAPPVV